MDRERHHVLQRPGAGVEPRHGRHRRDDGQDLLDRPDELPPAAAGAGEHERDGRHQGDHQHERPGRLQQPRGRQRPAVGAGNEFPDAEPQSVAYSDSHPDADAHSDPDANTNPHAHAHAQSHTDPGTTPTPSVALSASADSYVRDGSYAGQNFGGATPLLVKGAISGGGYVRSAYLQFDLSGVTDPINSAVLQLTASEQVGSAEASIPIAVYAVSDTGWTETGITYATAPAAGQALASGSVAGTNPQVYTFDLTSYLQQEQALGHTVVSFAIQGTTFTSGMAQFDSREGASGPQLLLATTTPTPTP